MLRTLLLVIGLIFAFLALKDIWDEEHGNPLTTMFGCMAAVLALAMAITGY